MDGQLALDTKHPYYFQVQMQMGVCKLESAYFVVWTEKSLHIELVTFEPEFWEDMCRKSKHVFDTAIMPELVGKFYSR